MYPKRILLRYLSGISYRRYIAYIQCERKSVRAIYGEMLTYLGMTMPMAIFALISWLKNPHNGNKAEVKVNSLGKNADNTRA